MSAESTWDRDRERESAVLLSKLEDLKLITDGGANATNKLIDKISAMEVSMTRMEGIINHQGAEIQELKEKLANANKWLMGMVAAMIVSFSGWAFSLLVAAASHGVK